MQQAINEYTNDIDIDFEAMVQNIGEASDPNNLTCHEAEVLRLIEAETTLLNYRDIGAMPHNIADELLRVCRAAIVDGLAVLD